MSLLKIINTPPGSAPIFIREAWCGVVIENGIMPQRRHVFGVWDELPVDRFEIKAADALHALEKNNRIAAAWYKLQMKCSDDEILSFPAYVCESYDGYIYPPKELRELWEKSRS